MLMIKKKVQSKYIASFLNLTESDVKHAAQRLRDDE